MHIPPKRRQRALRAHYLSQRGHARQQIAEQLGVSRATVRADLQLVETHWSSIAAPAADDLLLESLQLLQIRLALALQHDHVAANADRLTPVEYLRARDAQETQFTALAREIRRTVQGVHRRAEQRPDQPGLYEEQTDDLTKTTPKLPKTDHLDSTLSSPEQEIVPEQAPEENSPPEPVQPPESPTLDAVIDEAVQHFPHLEGQSEEQVLAFLDQLTDPDAQDPELPPPIYAEAAG